MKEFHFCHVDGVCVWKMARERERQGVRERDGEGEEEREREGERARERERDTERSCTHNCKNPISPISIVCDRERGRECVCVRERDRCSRNCTNPMSLMSVLGAREC